MLKHISSLAKSIKVVRFGYSNAASLFCIRDIEADMSIDIGKSLQSLATDKKVPTFVSQHPNPEVKDTETQQQQEQQDDIEVQEETVENQLMNFDNTISLLLQEGKFQKLEDLIESTMDRLKKTKISETHLIQFISIIRGMRYRVSNKLLLTSGTETLVKSFITDPKFSMALNRIVKNWEKFPLPLLTKLTALYRYLPNKIVIGSLKKLLANSKDRNLGPTKHFQIINELMQKKETLQLGPMSHDLILKGDIIYTYLKFHFHDLEILFRFYIKYGAFAGSKMLGGLVYQHVNIGGKGDRKGYKIDYEYVKLMLEIYYSCLYLKTRVRSKFIEQVPYQIRAVLENEVPSLEDLLDGFLAISSFRNNNYDFSMFVAENIVTASKQELKLLSGKINSYMKYLFEYLNPEYCLDSMQLPSNKLVSEGIINSIRMVLPLCLDSFVLQFLQYRLDPYAYGMIFTNESQFAPFLDKYIHMLGNYYFDPLPILKFLNSNLKHIRPDNIKLREAIEESWKKLNKDYQKWPNSIGYYYQYAHLAKHMGMDLNDLNGKIQKLFDKLKANKSIYSTRTNKAWPMVKNSIHNMQYLLPLIQMHNLSSELQKPGVSKFVDEELRRMIRNWGSIQFYINLNAVCNCFVEPPRMFLRTMLSNISLLTLMNKDITIIHPDVDPNTISKIVQLVLDNYTKLQLQDINIKVFQMLCLLCEDLFINNNQNVKKLVEILGFKEQKYIPEMTKFLEDFHFNDPKIIRDVVDLYPPTFKNIQIEEANFQSEADNKDQISNNRELRKYMTVVLDKPKMRLKQELRLEDMPGREDRVLFLCNKYYEAILNLEGSEDIMKLEVQIAKMFKSKSQLSHHDKQKLEEELAVFEQFETADKHVANTKFQLLKFDDIGAKQFQTVELFDYPIEEEILRNINNTPYLENEILPKLNDDIREAFEAIKPWIEKMGIINTKIRNNTIIMRGRQRKNWPKSVSLVVSKPEVFKLNLICIYKLNKTSDTQFVVIEEESSIENAIKNFIYKKHNMI